MFACLPNPSIIAPSWEVDGTPYRFDQLTGGDLPGHNASGNNITVSAPVNGTKYVCVFGLANPTRILMSDPAFLYIAGEYVCGHYVVINMLAA